MARNILSWLTALGLGLSACNPAYADRPSAPPTQRAGVLAPVPVASPYQVELLGEGGVSLATYQHRGRIYVLGAAGQRYSIRVSNSTGRRVEAVLSVDGLDVIDGRTAALSKRGYVVPPYGTLVVDGFRVSTEQVAAFRFSSVNNSYAGRKGQARNVGVIGVALFEEQAPPQIVTPPPQIVTPRPPPPTRRPTWGADHWAEEKASGAPSSARSRADKAAAPRAAPSAQGGYGSGSVSAEAHREPCCDTPERPGLGTEFGEQRHSTVSWTQFVRSNTGRPSAVLEMRYNDVPGLRALGIAIEPPVNRHEVMTRETASPFPGSRFAEPPR